MDVVELCKKHQSGGVVAIDLAGDESLNCEANPEHRKAYEVSVCVQRRVAVAVSFVYYKQSLARHTRKNTLCTNNSNNGRN